MLRPRVWQRAQHLVRVVELDEAEQELVARRLRGLARAYTEALVPLRSRQIAGAV